MIVMMLVVTVTRRENPTAFFWMSILTFPKKSSQNSWLLATNFILSPIKMDVSGSHGFMMLHDFIIAFILSTFSKKSVLLKLKKTW